MRDFLLAAGQDEDDDVREDYLRGLLATSITIFSFFVFWIVVLLIFKYFLGPYSPVGWLSGSQIPLPPKPLANDYAVKAEQSTKKEESRSQSSADEVASSDHEEIKPSMEKYETAFKKWDELYQRRNKRMNALRAIVLLAGLSIIVCAILLSAKGCVY